MPDQQSTQDQQLASPIQLNIDYPERLSRITTLFRFILIIPILIVMGLITENSSSITLKGPSVTYANHYIHEIYHHSNPSSAASNIITIDDTEDSSSYHGHHNLMSSSVSSPLLASTAFLFLGPLVMLLFRKKYPKWWFNWNVELMSFLLRISAYLYFLTDQYPSTDEQQRIHVDIPYIDGQSLNRGLPLVKWFLAIPHYVILIVLGLIGLVFTALAWICIIFTGRYPRVFFDFVVGVMRWSLRVTCYAILLTTDKYPPFTMKP